jgi:hypothetical protein
MITPSTVMNLCLFLFGFLQLQVILLTYLVSRMAKLGYEQSMHELQDFAKQQLQEMRIAKLEHRIQESCDSEIAP